MTAYRDGYLAGYHFGDIAPDPTYRGEELRQYWRGFEQGEIDRAMGHQVNETNGEKIERPNGNTNQATNQQ